MNQQLIMDIIRGIPELDCQHVCGNHPKEWKIFKDIFGDDFTWEDFCHIREFFWVGGGVNIFAPTSEQFSPVQLRQAERDGCFLCLDKEYSHKKFSLLAKMLYGAALTSETFKNPVNYEMVFDALQDFLKKLNDNGLTMYQLHTRY